MPVGGLGAFCCNSARCEMPVGVRGILLQFSRVSGEMPVRG